MTTETATFIVAHVLLTILVTLFMVARFGSKRSRSLPWTADDWLLLAALLFLYLLFVVEILAATFGSVGSHLSTITLEDLERTLLILWVVQFPHAIALTLVRWAIIIFCIRTFFDHIFPRLRLLARLCLAVTFLWLLIFFIVVLSHCKPIRQNWTPPINDPRHCYSLAPLMIAQPVSTIVMDGIIWSLPHFVVWRLQLRRVHKVAISIIFGLGLLCGDADVRTRSKNPLMGSSNIVMAAFRLASILSVDVKGDLTYAAGPALIWFYAQVSTAIIVACCPLLRPAFEKLLPKRLTRLASPSSARSRPISLRLAPTLPIPPSVRIARTLPVPPTPHGIRVTSRIEVHHDSVEPHDSPRTPSKDCQTESWGSTSNAPPSPSTRVWSEWLMHV